MTALTIVADMGDWVIAAEDLPKLDDEACVGDNADFCYRCHDRYVNGEDEDDLSFFDGAGSGRMYCGCGYWYDRWAWRL